MTVQVNRQFAEVAQETRQELRRALVQAVRNAFPDRADQAEQLVETATQWMGRNLPAVNDPS